MASFHCVLSVDSQEFPVTHCVYEFSQATNERGRVAAKVRSGLITLQLDVPESNELVAWAIDSLKKLSGSLVFEETNRPIAREKLVFEDGFCVSYEEIFVSGAGTDGAYTCVLQISAAKLALGLVETNSQWHQTR